MHGIEEIHPQNDTVTEPWDLLWTRQLPYRLKFIHKDVGMRASLELDLPVRNVSLKVSNKVRLSAFDLFPFCP